MTNVDRAGPFMFDYGECIESRRSNRFGVECLSHLLLKVFIKNRGDVPCKEPAGAAHLKSVKADLQQAILFKRFEIFQLQGVLLFESDTALLYSTPGKAARSPDEILVANPPAAHNLHDDSLSDSIFFGKNQFMDNRQHPLIQHLIVTSQIFCILIEPHLILGDGRHAESDHLQLGMGTVPLKISLECTVAKRLAQTILFSCEMIHSDKLILSAFELLHRQQKHLCFLLG